MEVSGCWEESAARGKEGIEGVDDCPEGGGREETKGGNAGAGIEEEEGEEEGEMEDRGEEAEEEEEHIVSEPSAKTVSYFEARSRYCSVLFRGYARFLKALLRALANQFVSWTFESPVAFIK